MRNEFEATNESTLPSKIAGVIAMFTGVLLVTLAVGVPIWYLFGIDFTKVLAVSLALATLQTLVQVLEVGGSRPPY